MAIKRFCVECGTSFESDSKMIRYCPECAEKHKAEAKQKQKAYAKERQERLGLVNITVYKTDKEKLMELAEAMGEGEKRITVADVVQKLLAERKTITTTKKAK